MAYPNFEEPFLLHTDESETGLGAVLYQQQNGVLRVIAYGSPTLSPSEQSCHLHSGKLEFLALKWSICEQFWDYLYYALSFRVYTDNKPLTYVLTSAKLKGELQRQNKLISSERPFKLLQNETKIIEIGQAVLEIFNFKD